MPRGVTRGVPRGMLVGPGVLKGVLGGAMTRDVVGITIAVHMKHNIH